MGFELALYLGEPNQVAAVESAIKDGFARRKIVRGSLLIDKLAAQVPGELRVPLLLLLLRERVLLKARAAATIDGYLLELDNRAFDSFFANQRLAAEVVKEARLTI